MILRSFAAARGREVSVELNKEARAGLKPELTLELDPSLSDVSIDRR